MTLDVGGWVNSSPFFEYSMPSGSKLRAHLLSPADGKVQDLMREKGYWKEFISIHRSGGEFVSIKRSELLSYLRQQEGSEEVKAIAEGRLNSCEIPLEEGEFYALMSLESSSISGGASDSSWMKQVEESEEALSFLERRYEKRLAASEPGSNRAGRAESDLKLVRDDRKKLEEFRLKEGKKCFADIWLVSFAYIDGMDYAQKLIAAVASDDLERVRELLDEAESDQTIIDLDANEVSVVNCALRKGNGEIIQALLSSICIHATEADATALTPLETALQLHRIDDAKTLLTLLFSWDIKGLPEGKRDGFFEKWIESIDAINATFSSEEKRIDSKELALEAVRGRPGLLSDLPVKLRGDRAVVLAAISASGKEHYFSLEELLPLIDEKLLSDKEVIRALVSKEGMIYSKLPFDMQADREIALLALRSSKPINDFSMLSPFVMRDKEVLLESAARYPMQWQTISFLLSSNRPQEGVRRLARQAGPQSDFVPVRQRFGPTLYLKRDELVSTLRRMNPSEAFALFIDGRLNGEKALEALDFRALLLLAHAPLESSSIAEQFDACKKRIEEVEELHVILRKGELYLKKRMEREAQSPGSTMIDVCKSNLLGIGMYRKRCELLATSEKQKPMSPLERQIEGSVQVQKIIRAIKSNDFDKVKRHLSYFEKKRVEMPVGGLEGDFIFVEAIRSGNQKIIQLLINSPSVDLDEGDSRGNNTPLMLAAREGDIETVRALLKKGVQLQTYDPWARSALSFAYGHVREELLKEYEKDGIDPVLETNYKHYLLLAGVHGMKLDVNLQKEEITTLEGGFPEIAGLDALQLISNATPEQLSIDEAEKRELLDGFETAKINPRRSWNHSHSEQLSIAKNRETIIKNIGAGKTAIINAGWESHAIALVITGDYLHICNRGAGREVPHHMPAIVSYKIDRKALSPGLLNEIFRHASGSGEEALSFIYKTLPKLVKGESDELTRCLELSSVDIKFQIVGNCWVASTKTAELALLASIRIKRAQAEGKPLGDAYISAYRSYKKFTSYWRIQSSLALHQAWSSDSSITLNALKKEEFFKKLEKSKKKDGSWFRELAAGKLTYARLLKNVVWKQPDVMAQLPAQYRKDKAIALSAIEGYEDQSLSVKELFSQLDKSLFSDRDVVEAIVDNEGGLYPQMPLKMRSDREITLLAIQSEHPLDDYSSIPKHLLLDREIMLEFLVRHPSQWNKLEKELRHNRDFVTDLFQLLTTQKKYPAELHSSAQQIFNSLTPTLKANKGVVKAYRHFQHLLRA